MENLQTYIWSGILVVFTIIAIRSLYVKNERGQRKFMLLLKSIHDSKNPHNSWIRWASSFVIVATFGLAWYQQATVGSVQESLVIGLVALALTGKVAQKALEVKSESKEENDDEYENL